MLVEMLRNKVTGVVGSEEDLGGEMQKLNQVVKMFNIHGDHEKLKKCHHSFMDYSLMLESIRRYVGTDGPAQADGTHYLVVPRYGGADISHEVINNQLKVKKWKTDALQKGHTEEAANQKVTWIRDLLQSHPKHLCSFNDKQMLVEMLRNKVTGVVGSEEDLGGEMQKLNQVVKMFNIHGDHEKLKKCHHSFMDYSLMLESIRRYVGTDGPAQADGTHYLVVPRYGGADLGHEVINKRLKIEKEKAGK